MTPPSAPTPRNVSTVPRRIGLHMYVTLDGYNDFPNYPGSGDPPRDETGTLTEEIWVKRWGEIDALLFDRETYDQWAEFWPVANRTADEHPWYRQMSEFTDRAEKVVFSADRDPGTWAHTRFLPGELGAEVERLRHEAGKNLAVVAPALGMELIRRDLIDDYFFAVFPVILGKGHQFFGPLGAQRTLRLVEVKAAKAGELFVHYESVR